MSDRPPSSCTDSYLPDLLDLLAQTVQVARQRKLRAMIWAGDVFHSKTPGRTSHELVQAMARLIESYPCPVLIVPGNHDIQYDRLETIYETQPLGALLLTPNAHLLSGWWRPPGETFYEVYGVPWQQKWDDDHVYAAFADWRSPLPPVGHVLAVAHAPLYPPGQELKWESYPAAKWTIAMGDTGACFYGHVHEPHGAYRVDDVVFCNNGALSRGSLHEYNLTRQVGMTIWDGQSGLFEFVPLNAKPAAEVFRLKERAQVTDMQGRLDEFLASVGSATLQVVSAETVIEHINGLQLPAGDAALAQELITWAAVQK